MSDFTDAWPAYSDDSGALDDGTPVSANLLDGMRDAVDDQVTSATNPNQTPAETTDEVIAARDGEASLSARIAAVEAAAGTGFVTTAQGQASNFENLVANGIMKLWSAGDSAAPDFFTSSGSPTIARAGVGLGDTTQLKVGDFCTKVTYNAAEGKLTQILVDAAAFARFGNLKGRQISVGCHMKSSVGSIGRIVIDDGVTTIVGTLTATNTDTWVTASGTISASATKLDVYLSITGAGTVYFSGLCVTLSALAPVEWMPERWVRGFGSFILPGTQVASAGTPKFYFGVDQPSIITWMQLRALTAPTGAALIFDLRAALDATPTYGSMYTGTLPQIAISGISGGLAPNGTYARRCLVPLHGATLAAGKEVAIYCTQVGSTIPGSDVTIRVDILKVARPFECLLDYNDLG